MNDQLLSDLPKDMPTFLERFGTDELCRQFIVQARWSEGFRCSGCGNDQAYSHKKRLIEECRACGKQHSILAGTIFEQTKTGLAKWFLAIYLVTSSKGGIAAAELQRQLGFKSAQTAWTWLHKLRRAMKRPGREPLCEHVEADETYIGAPRPGVRGRGAKGKSIAAGAVEIHPGQGARNRLGRLRLQQIPDSSAQSLENFLQDNTTKPITVTTDAWKGYNSLENQGYTHDRLNISQSENNASTRMPAIHLVFGLTKRWLLGTHHGAVRAKHLQAYLDEYVFRFNRRMAKCISHRFARLVQYALQTKPATYRSIVNIPHA